MIIGMDFGTTHSGMAAFDGRELRPVPLHGADAAQRVTPTMLYVMNDQKIAFGRDAMETYYAQNLGRPVKMERVWVGEISLTFAELPTFVRDVYIWVDALSPGRLFLSFKTDLSDISYQGTTVGRFFYRLEDIVAMYLHMAKARAERHLDRELDSIVLGRPVHFNEDPQANALAQERLLDGALRAGYKSVYFEYEPVAAAYYYALSIDQPQNVLVFDFGGGTLDATVMRLGEAGGQRVLATGGVPIAGDLFDRKLVQEKLPQHFGRGSFYRSHKKWLPIPEWIYESFSDWRAMLTLQTPENLQIIQSMIATAQEPQQLEALLKLISSNYGLRMFDAVESVKRRLSTRKEGVVRLAGDGFHVRQPVARYEFEALIAPEYRIIEQHVDETVRASGLRPEQFDVVLRTGGSSQIPLFQRMLEEKFGAERVRAVDTFGSVTSGLGVIGHRIERGEIDARVYTKSTRVEHDASSRRNVPPVDLDLLMRQIELEEQRTEADGDAANERGVALIDREYMLHTVPLPHTQQGATRQAASHKEAGLSVDGIPFAVQAAALDDPLLLVTSRFRLLLVTLRELLTYRESAQSMAQVRGFESGEQMCSLSRWQPLRAAEQLIILSTQGHVRAFDMAYLTPLVEGPTPHRIGWSQPGWPKAVIAASPGDAVVAINSHGRAARTSVDTLPRNGIRLLQKRKADELMGAIAGAGAAEFVLVATQGYAKRFTVDQVPDVESATASGSSMLRRRGEICGVLTAQEAGGELWLLSTKRLIPATLADLPLEPDSQAMQRMVSLGKGETLVSVFGNA